MADRDTYPRSLVVLHWTIVALIVAQLFTADWMEDFFRPAAESGKAPGFPTGLALFHAGFGATILILVLVRFYIRMSSRVPPPPADLPRTLQLVSRLNHYAFYVVLVLLPLTGVTSILITPEAGDVHELLKNILFVLIAAHVLGALTHLIVLRDGVVGRMIPALRR